MNLNFKTNVVKIERWKTPVNRKDYLKLDLNENYSLLDKKILKKLLKIDYFTISCYPEYDCLLSLLAKYTKVNSKNITITNGADQAIDLLLRLFFDKENRVILPSPVFSMYDHVFSVLGTKLIHIPYLFKDSSFKFPIKEVLDSLSQSDGIVLCNPNNPLGSIIEENDITKIIKETNKLNIPCIIDEAYFEFYGKTNISLVKKYSNLIIIRTFSKIFGLAGLRLGYIISNSNVTEQLLKLRGPWDVNHFAVKAGEFFLNESEIFAKKLNEFKENRQDLISFLKLKEVFVYDSYTNFITVRFDEYPKILEDFKKNNILINDVSNYPFNFGLLKNCIRITIPAKKDLLKIKKMFL
jgi:histidinol-phosphate aminotransferase